METLSQTYKWYIWIQNNSFNEKYGYMEICTRLLRKLWWKIGWVMIIPSALIHIPLYHSDKNTIGVAGLILMTIQCILLILSIYPTEKALKIHFYDDGTRR